MLHGIVPALSAEAGGPLWHDPAFVTSKISRINQIWSLTKFKIIFLMVFQAFRQ